MVSRLEQHEVVSALLGGGVVALPTDTVYGLAARFDHAAAIADIFALKQRPRDVALPVMVSGPEQLKDLGVAWSEPAQMLAEHFWPGPLTIVVPVSEDLATRAGASGTLGFRVPAQAAVVDVLSAVGPLAVTSANRHGATPCATADDVLTVFAGSTLSGVLDGGRCGGEVSSVVLLDQGWRVLRAGAISADVLTALLGPPVAE